MHYDIRIEGALSDRLLLAFPECDAEISDGETRLLGIRPDQPALHAMLAKVESLGLTLLEVQRRS
jgi:hypothetical protein